jgi:hypothetical protein
MSSSRKRSRDKTRRKLYSPANIKESRNKRELPTELEKTQILWEAPELIYKKYGLRGVLRSFMLETLDGKYSNDEVNQIKNVTKKLASESEAFESGNQLLEKVVSLLTEDMSKEVRKNLWLIALSFTILDDVQPVIDNREPAKEVENLKFRF